MRKFLFFAFALVAGALAFTSCDNSNDPNNPLVGTWSVWQSGDFYNEISFDGNSTYTTIQDYYFYDGEAGELIPTPHEHVVIKGSYTIDGDIVTIHQTSQTISMDGGAAENIEWEPEDEQIKFKVEGNTLTLTRNYGTEYQSEQVFTKK